MRAVGWNACLWREDAASFFVTYLVQVQDVERAHEHHVGNAILVHLGQEVVGDVERLVNLLLAAGVEGQAVLLLCSLCSLLSHRVMDRSMQLCCVRARTHLYGHDVVPAAVQDGRDGRVALDVHPAVLRGDGGHPALVV